MLVSMQGRRLAMTDDYWTKDNDPEFVFHREDDGGLSPESAVFQALGAASTCWDSMKEAGEFHSTRCKLIGETLLAELTQVDDLNSFAKAIHETAVIKGWWEGDRNFGEIIANIHSEVSEAWHEWVMGHAMTETYYIERGKPEGVPTELADILIRTLDIAAAYGIDIQKVFDEKRAYNSGRSYKHGGKRA